MTPRILLVEDDLRAASATQRELARAGFTDVTCVCDQWPEQAASAAASVMDAWEHDVVVCDGLEGHWTLMECSSPPRSVVLYTGTPHRYANDAGRRGVQVVSKPDGAALVAAVRAVLAKTNTKEVRDG